LVQLDLRISRLPDADLQRGLRWTTEQGWLDEKTKGLLTLASKKLTETTEGASHE
jgi:hypothetical protein